MALHTRELVRCVTAAIARQLQVCARPAPACGSAPAVSVTCFRGFSSSAPYGNSVRPPGSRPGGPGKGLRGTQAGSKVKTERLRIKLPATSSLKHLNATAAENPSKGSNSKKATNQSTKTNTEGTAKQSSPKIKSLLRDFVDKHAAESKTYSLIAKNKVAANKDTQSQLPSQDVYFRPHRKETAKAKKPTAETTGRSQKKRDATKPGSEASLIEPMSKLSRDINQWFSDVMEHLAKAESASPSSVAHKFSAAQKKQQQAAKSKPTSKSKEPAQKGYNESANKDIHDVEDLSLSAQKEQVRVVSSTVKKVMPTGEEHGHKVFGSLSTPNPSVPPRRESFSGSAERNLKSQLAALNGELSRQGFGNSTGKLEENNSGVSRFENDRAQMMEIRPSLVENSDTPGTPVSPAAAWFPYGAPPAGPLAEIPASQGSSGNGGQSKARLSAKSSAASAMAASEIFSGSSRHELVTKSVSVDGVASGTSKVTKKNSWEKGKGFILLNNKEKEQEALERKAWLEQQRLEKQQNAKTSGNSDTRSFILVDSKEPTKIPSTASTTKKNILLSDNPHEAALQRASAKKDVRKASGVQNMASAGGESKKTKPKKETSLADKKEEPVGKTGKAKSETSDVAPDAEINRWVDLVHQKLFQMQKSKSALAETAQVTKLQFRREAGTTQSVDKATEHDGPKARLEQVSGVRAGSNKGMQARPDVANTPGVVPPQDTKPSAPTGPRNPDPDQAKGSISEPKPSDSSDAEYERRIRQFINSSMDYEEPGDLNKISKFFGPITRDQHALLEKARTTGNSGHTGDFYIPQAGRSSPVAIGELKPEIKRASKKMKAEKVPERKNEPKLCVKPEEIATVKRQRSSSLAQILNLSKEVKNHDKKSKPQKTSRNTRAVSEPSAKENRIFREEPVWAASAKPYREIDSHVPVRSAGKDDSPPRKEKGGSFKKSKSSNHLSKSRLSDDKILTSFEHEFLKLQQDKIIKSLSAKSLQEAKEKAMIPASPATNSAQESKKNKREELTESPKHNSSQAATKMSPKERSSAPGKTEPNPREGRQTPIESSPSKELDPFEAWVQSMEEHSAAKREAHLMGNNSILTEEISAKQKTGTKTKKKKKYWRFEAKALPEMVSIDTCGQSAAKQKVPSDLTTVAESRPERAPRKLSPVTQSDQLYSMIRDSAQPGAGIHINNIIDPTGRRSKVLTQAGLGAVISHGTGLVDPARLPKLGNLFRSFDGFLAMEAIPVVLPDTKTKAAEPVKTDAAKEKDSASCTAKDSLSSGDGNTTVSSDPDLRASLAREREAATVAARRKLIEEYEKNIRSYEKGLELYRSRLRRVKQSMKDQDRKVPESDNPRRRTDP
ncbi:hypothetical protein EGW08_005033 [Elysia chlorotica]|uniref:Uncharacterized protein n=1 Tax=Elysia chlorotica TaxID=188477 RepID=A0A3S1HW01_ELYCH|nr:hypothetical protein EGW08_005033 [Elysia chlorotica]